MRVIWKYPLEIVNQQDISVPLGADLLHIGVQDGTLCLWASVDPRATPMSRSIWIVGTGHRYEPTAWNHLGTVQIGDFVWHVFEEVPF